MTGFRKGGSKSGQGAPKPLARGTKLRTSYGREHVILAGPWRDNVSTWYAVRDLTDNLVQLNTEGQVAGWDEVVDG